MVSFLNILAALEMVNKTTTKASPSSTHHNLNLSFLLALAMLFFSNFSPAFSKEQIIAASPKQMVMNSFAGMVDNLLPSVVNISITTKKNLQQEFGSGFIISKDGFIVTNSHVINEASEISVSLNSDEKYKAKIIGIDKKTDLALLKIEAEKDLKFATLGDSNKSRVGDWVVVIGNPYGLGLSVSTGIISAKARNITNNQLEEFIQTDAAINNGNSGGPMFNLKGEIIGISTSIISPSGGSIGLGFAIPSSSAIQIINQLKNQGEVIRGWIGVSVQNVSGEIAEIMKVEKNKGAFVNEVLKGSPAELAGILPTDIILKIDEQEINEMRLLPKTISKYDVGRIAKITILRRGKVKLIKVKVAKMKEEEAASKEILLLPDKKLLNKSSEQILGIGMLALNPSVRKTNNIDNDVNGILITEINLASEAASKGLALGDIILSINQAPVLTIDDLKEEIANNVKLGKKIYLFVKRGNSNFGMMLNAK